MHACWGFLPEGPSLPGTKAFGKSSSVNLCLRLWSRRGRLCLLSRITSLLNTPSICFPLKTFSHSPLHADILPIFTFDQYSCLHPCIPGSRVARPDHLTNMSCYHYLQSLIDWHCSISISFVVIHCWYGLQLDARIVILHNISRTFSLCTSLADSRAWSHLVSKSWVSSPCKDTLNRSDRSSAASWAPVVGKLGRAQLTRHGRFHRNLQLSPCLLKGFLELSIYRINELDASQVSRIVEPSVHR